MCPLFLQRMVCFWINSYKFCACWMNNDIFVVWILGEFRIALIMRNSRGRYVKNVWHFKLMPLLTKSDFELISATSIALRHRSEPQICFEPSGNLLAHLVLNGSQSDLQGYQTFSSPLLLASYKRQKESWDIKFPRLFSYFWTILCVHYSCNEWSVFGLTVT